MRRIDVPRCPLAVRALCAGAVVAALACDGPIGLPVAGDPSYPMPPIAIDLVFAPGLDREDPPPGQSTDGPEIGHGTYGQAIETKSFTKGVYTELLVTWETGDEP